MTQNRLIRGFIDTRRGMLHYKEIGSGRPIVLLQILPFSTAMFEPLMPWLAQLDYRVIALDLMGYGASDARQNVWMVEDHADALAEVVENLGGSLACLVSGHFTGMVATEFALRHSSGLHRLVLDGVPLWPRDIAQQRLQTMTAPKVWNGESGDVGALWVSAFGLMRKFDPDLKPTEETMPRITEAFCGFVRTVQTPGSTEPIFRYDMAEKLKQLTIPTLVIGSPTDSLRDRHEAAIALIPGAKGHLFETTHPLYRFKQDGQAQAYARLLDGFIRE